MFPFAARKFVVIFNVFLLVTDILTKVLNKPVLHSHIVAELTNRRTRAASEKERLELIAIEISYVRLRSSAHSIFA